LCSIQRSNVFRFTTFVGRDRSVAIGADHQLEAENAVKRFPIAIAPPEIGSELAWALDEDALNGVGHGKIRNGTAPCCD